MTKRMTRHALALCLAAGWLAGCSGESPEAKAWAEASAAGTEQAYVQYLNEYPAASQAFTARARILADHLDAAAAAADSPDVPVERLDALKQNGRVPADAKDEERQAILLLLAEAVASMPVEARQSVPELTQDLPDPPLSIGSLSPMTGEVLVRGLGERHDIVSHMSVKQAKAKNPDQENVRLFTLETHMPKEQILLNIKSFDMNTISVNAELVFPVGEGSLLTFWGPVEDFLPGWTFAPDDPEEGFTFVWMEEGLTYLAGAGAVTGPNEAAYRFDSLFGVAPEDA